METKIRILLYEDNRDLREGMTFLLQATPGLQLIGAFPDTSNLEMQIPGLKPDVVLMDIDMPGRTGIEATPIVKALRSETQVLMLTVFEDEDRQLESLTSVDAFGEPYLFKDVYTYDANGDNDLIETFLVDGGQELPSSRLEMEFENHLLTLETAFEFDGAGFLPQIKVAYEHTSFEKEETVERYEWDASTGDWFNTQTDTFEYDGLQRLGAKETTFHYQGEIERYRFTYAYIEDENLALETSYFFDFNQNEFLVGDRKYYYYGSGVSAAPYIPQPVYALNMSPNPTTRFAQIQLEGEVSVQVFDGMGRLVQWQNDESGQVNLDLYELPAGIYTIRALDSSKYYVGRLVKQ